MTLKPKPACPRLHEFIATLNDYGLEQLDEELDNTKSTQLIRRVEVLLGLSDHNAVYCEVIIHPQKRKRVPRLIPLYKKADWDQLRRAMTDLADRMEPLKDSATSEELWTLFRDTLRMTISDCIPHKQAWVMESKPWISPTLHSPAHQEERPCFQEDAEARHRGTEGPVLTIPNRSPAPAAESILGLPEHHLWRCRRWASHHEQMLAWTIPGRCWNPAWYLQGVPQRQEPSWRWGTVGSEDIVGHPRGARATRGLRNDMGKAQTPRKRNPLHLHYRPAVADEVNLSRFNASLALATAIPNANVLNGGDLNFPSWDWKLKTLKPKPACPRLHHEFITMLND